MPTVNRGKYRGKNGRYRLPAGYLEDRVGVWPEQEIKN